MTKLDFPDTPSTGQMFGSSGTVWRWDGTRWGSTAGASGARGRVAYAQITANQSNIQAGVDIAGLSVTWTADPSRTYRTSAFGHIQSTVASDTCIAYIKDAAGNIKTSDNKQLAINTGSWNGFYPSVIETGLSGSQTRKVYAIRNGGSGTPAWMATPTTPSFILVEDITYEAGSGGPVGPYVTVAELSQYPRIEVRGGVPLANNSGTSVLLNAWAALTYSVGPAGQWGGGGAGTIQCKAPYAGRWNFSYSMNWTSNPTGARQSWMGRSDGVRFGQQMVGPSPGGADHINTGSANIMLTADQWVGLYAYQSSGAVLNVATSSESYFMGYYLGPA